MGGAVAEGLLDSGFAADCLTLANPSQEKLKRFAERGVNCTASNTKAADDADLVIIAVKPWILKSVADELMSAPNMTLRRVAVIVAGVTGDDIVKMFTRADGYVPQLCIAMPNTAVAIRQSMTFLVPLNCNIGPAASLFMNLGAVSVIEERQLPAATALASCGIAYALRYVRAATEGGVELGFRAAEAQRIVAQTIKGAAALLDRPEAHAETEIDKVTTPGGLTIRGLNAMEQAGFTNAVIQGLKASVK